MYEYGDTIPETLDDAALRAQLVEADVTAQEAAFALKSLRTNEEICTTIGNLRRSDIPTLLSHVLARYDRSGNTAVDEVLSQYAVPAHLLSVEKTQVFSDTEPARFV